MKIKSGPALLSLGALVASASGASLNVEFQGTIASEQHPTYAGEARYYHVSVNPNNPGVGSYAATIVGSNDPAPTFVRNFTEDVIGYKWIGGTNNDISGVSIAGGEDGRITYATEDTTFDGFGQSQLKLWVETDPGEDLQTTIADPYSAEDDVGGTGGYRSFGGAVTTVDISGLTTGSVYVFYGAFNATPSLSVVMRDTDGGAPDIEIENAHLNGDNANRTEYYLAELKFANDAGYDEIVYTHLADGVGYGGNGRGLGTLLTGSTGTSFPLAITDFSYNSDTSTFDLTIQGAANSAYTLAEASDLGFDTPDSDPIPLDGATATVGTIDGNSITTDVNGTATITGVSFEVAKASSFIRAQVAVPQG